MTLVLLISPALKKLTLAPLQKLRRRKSPLSVPKISSGLEIVAVREIISNSAPLSGASLFRWVAPHLWSSSPLSLCSSGASSGPEHLSRETPFKEPRQRRYKAR